jgi:TrmH family RNA methyltransferase
MPTIRSRQHPFVQRCRELARRFDADTGAVLLDGVHVVDEAVSAGLTGLMVAIRTDVQAHDDVVRLTSRLRIAGAEILDASADVIDAASPVRSPSGVVAIGTVTARTTDDVFAQMPALVIAAVDVQDPGNIGAIIRSAEAAGATGVLVAGQSAHPLGWKAIRGSMGSVFRVPVVVAPALEDALDIARANGLVVLATTPEGGSSLYDVDLTQSTLVLVGAEGSGLSRAAVESADARVCIPMNPPVESLNVAVAAGVVLFEVSRQRRAQRFR